MPRYGTDHVDRFLGSLRRSWLLFCTPGLAVLAWQFGVRGTPARLVPYLALVSIGAGVLVTRGLDRWTRARLLIAVLCAIGTVTAIYAALLPGGLVFFGAATLVASIVFGYRGLMWTLASTALIFVSLALGFTSGALTAPDPSMMDPRGWGNWLRVGTGVLIPLATVASGAVAILESLQEALSGARVSESYYRTLFESSGDGVTILKRGRFVACNRAALEIFGYAERDLIGKEPSDVSPERQPDGTLSAQSAQQWMAAALCGPPQRFPWRHRRQDGLEFDVEVSLTSLALDDELCLLAVVRDISDRVRAGEALRDSEERYRQLFDAAGDAVFVHGLGPDGRAGRFLAVNDVACQNLGYSREELLAMSPADLAAPGESLDRARIVASYAAGEPTTFETVHLARGGRRIPVEIRARPFSLKGRPVVIALGRDVTERERAAQELQRLHMRLETIRSDESRRMARRVHDEVGQALTALQMDLARLRGEVTEEGPRASVEAASRLLLETIETVRGIAHELHPRILDDLGLAAAVRAHTRKIAERSGLAGKVDIRPDEILLDRRRAEAVYRVCCEALTNVLRHAGAKNVLVLLRQAEGWVELDVEDDGSGLSPEAKDGPVSLGLLYMRESMRALGGTASVTSAPGGGTIVSARIPDSDPPGTETPDGNGAGVAG